MVVALTLSHIQKTSEESENHVTLDFYASWCVHCVQKGGNDKPEKLHSTPVERREDCPVDKDELGSSTWNLLHTMSVTYPAKPTGEQKKDMADFLNTLSRVLSVYRLPFNSYLLFASFRPTRVISVRRISSKISRRTRRSWRAGRNWLDGCASSTTE